MIDTLFFWTLIGLSLISIPFWWGFVRRLMKRQRALEPRPRLASPIGFVDAIMFFLLWGLSQSIALALITPAATAVPTPSANETTQPKSMVSEPTEIASKNTSEDTILLVGAVALAQLLGTTLGLVVLGFRYGHVPRIFGLQPENIFRDLLIALVAFAMTIPLLLSLQALLGQLVEYKHSTIDLLRNSFGWRTMLFTWFGAVFVAPITEEIFFRGIVQSWLGRLGGSHDPTYTGLIALGGFANDDPETRSSSFIGMSAPFSKRSSKGPVVAAPPTKLKKDAVPFVIRDSAVTWMPILASSALFALAHLGQGLAPIALFVFGLVLGYLYRQTGSVWLCIILHMLLNGFSMFWVTLQLVLETTGTI